MNKKVIALLTTSISLFAQNSIEAGLGVAYLEQPYKGTSSRVLVLPFIDAKYNGFYLKGLEAGYEQKHKAISVGIFTKARMDGYEGSDSDWLRGMDERKYALEAGVKSSLDMDKIGKISAFVSGDISGAHNGYEVGVEYSKSYFYDKSIFIPFVALKKESKELTNYYYGVKNAEASPQRAAYSTNGALNADVGIRHIYRLSQQVALVGIASYARLDKTIYESPIVQKRDRTKLFLACSYKF